MSPETDLHITSHLIYDKGDPAQWGRGGLFDDGTWSTGNSYAKHINTDSCLKPHIYKNKLQVDLKTKYEN